MFVHHILKPRALGSCFVFSCALLAIACACAWACASEYSCEYACVSDSGGSRGVSSTGVSYQRPRFVGEGGSLRTELWRETDGRRGGEPLPLGWRVGEPLLTVARRVGEESGVPRLGEPLEPGETWPRAIEPAERVEVGDPSGLVGAVEGGVRGCSGPYANPFVLASEVESRRECRECGGMFVSGATAIGGIARGAAM